MTALKFVAAPELAYQRRVEFAVELLDAVTLERIAAGVRLVADGLRGTPRVNASGIFVWLREDRSALRSLIVDPQRLPYERVVLEPAAVEDFTRVELAPRADYEFGAGVTALRGTLLEQSGAPREPVIGARVGLRWLDDDGATWRDSPVLTHSDANGDFAGALRFGPGDAPRVTGGALSVRVRVTRDGAPPRESPDLKLPRGRTADPSTFAAGPGALTFAWDDLQL